MEVRLPFTEGAIARFPRTSLERVVLKSALTVEGLSLKETALEKKDTGFFHTKHSITPMINIQDYVLSGKIPADRRARNSSMANIHFDFSNHTVFLSDVNPLLARGELVLKLYYPARIPQ